MSLLREAIRRNRMDLAAHAVVLALALILKQGVPAHDGRLTRRGTETASKEDGEKGKEAGRREARG